MEATTKRRIGIGLDESDLELIEQLKARYGQIGVTAIIRMALRELARA
jgi:Ribbon-helix-helix protein, copG family